MMNRMFLRFMGPSIVKGYAYRLQSSMRLWITGVKPMPGNDWD
jgi:hypothetical protein